MTKKEFQFETTAIHAAQEPDKWMGSTIAPIFQTASHLYERAEDLSKVFAGQEPGYIYMRLRNPTNDALEKKAAVLEGGVGAVSTSSGMAAVNNAVMSMVRAGDHVVASRSLFMSTWLLFANILPRYGIEISMVDPLDLDAWKAAIKDNTRLLYLETIGNPAMDVPDVEKVAQIAHQNGVALLADNTMGTPWLFRPIEAGADIVVHSTTKFLNGHGSAVGGIIVDAGNFDWDNPRYPDFEPFIKRAGEKAFLDKVWREIHINFGTTAAPMHSYLTLIGIDTLALRMKKHCENASALVEFLASHPKVKWVNYPGREESPSHENAKKQFGDKGFGGILTFGLEDEKQCFKLVENLEMTYHLANLGDAKTLIIHPWSSQFVSFTEEKRNELGIGPGLLRVSAGIEDERDIIADFEGALEKV